MGTPIPPSVVPLFLISVVGLFLELLLIRWVSTEIRIFAYLQNTVLVVCFLGLGMGCWDARRRPFALRDMLVPLAVLTGLLAVPTTRLVLGDISTLLSGFDDLVIWGGSEAGGWRAVSAAVVGLALTFSLMILLWDIFVPVGRLLGEQFAAQPNTIWAYSVNVAGSLVGIWLFVVLSGLQLPPVAWVSVFVAVALPLTGTGGRSKAGDAALLAALLPLAWLAGTEPGWDEVRWSPYQKLTVRDMDPPGGREPTVWAGLYGERVPGHSGVGRHFIGVNNIGYQAMVDQRPETVARRRADYPDLFPESQQGYSQYDLPAKFHPKPERVLIVGAGSGNDAAGALRNGAGRVVAVDIDPAIIALGRRLHPEQPYSDPRVEVVNDDARSFFATTTDKFDVIAFGLLDSHTTTAMTNARLDHYVYTRESLEHAKTLLAPGGVVVLSFEAQKPFIADRMTTALTEVFGRPPRVFRIPFNGYGWGGVVFVTGDPATIDKQFAADPKLAERVAGWTQEYANTIDEWKAKGGFGPDGRTRVATDDWPYLYLDRPRVPVLYGLLAAALGLLFWRGVRKLDAPDLLRGWGTDGWHFFFLGAAFMLLEVQNISKAAVVLGNTWTVNAVVISGILGMVLAANALAAGVPRLPVGAAYAGLILCCLGLYVTDLAQFAFLPYATKVAVVGGLTGLPMLFSGIVFVKSFAAADRKDAALGANLFGSLVGGLLQTATFVVGIKALLLVVAGLYVAAMLTRPRTAPGPRRLVEA